MDADDPQAHVPVRLRPRARKFVVPICPDYHTELLPDSILNTESPDDFVENKTEPQRAEQGLHLPLVRARAEGGGHHRVLPDGGIEHGPAWYTSVATTIGVVQEVIDGIPDLTAFIAACRKRSVFSDKELKAYWDYFRRAARSS